MKNEIAKVICSVYGKKCCRVAVGKFKSLSIGFGEKVFHNNERLKDNYYGEWEIGTYYGSWRIIMNNQIVLGSNDSNDINILNDKICEYEIDELAEISNITDHDVQLVFKNGTIIEIITTFSDKDELFHIFCPENIFVEFTTEGIWKIGKSDVPWTE